MTTFHIIICHCLRKMSRFVKMYQKQPFNLISWHPLIRWELRNHLLSQSRVRAWGNGLLGTLAGDCFHTLHSSQSCALSLKKFEQINWRASNTTRWEAELVQRVRSQPKDQKNWRKSFRRMLNEMQEL